MSTEATTYDATAQAAPEKGSILAAWKRGTTGLVDGAQTGAIIGACLTGAAVLADALGMGGAATHFLFHGADPVMGAVGLTAAHSVGAAAFEGVTEAYDAYHGKGPQDHIRETAEELDRKILGREENTPGRSQAYAFDAPRSQSSPTVQAILAQGAPSSPAISWQDRLAAQQAALAASQERNV